MLQTIAIHDVRPEHVDAFRAFTGKVEAAVAGAPGLIEIASWREVHTGRLVAVARWESQAAFQAAAPAIMGLSSQRDPARTDRDDDLLDPDRRVGTGPRPGALPAPPASRSGASGGAAAVRRRCARANPAGHSRGPPP